MEKTQKQTGAGNGANTHFTHEIKCEEENQPGA